MNNIKYWLNAHKVLLIGLITAIAMPVYDLIQNGETSTKVIVLAAATALISWLGRNMRGQWVTIVGILGSTVVTKLGEEGEVLNWKAVALQVIIQMLALATPAPKSRGYEETDIIMEAKREGELIEPTVAPPPSTEL